MGKSLIIKGADFSVNGIAPEFTRLAWIGMSSHNGADSGTTSGQFISSGIMTSLTTKIVVTAEFATSNDYSVILPGSYVNNPSTFHAWAHSSYTTGKCGIYNTTNNTVSSVDAQKKLWDGDTHVIAVDKTGITIDGTLYSFTNVPIDMWSSPIYLDSSSRSSADGYNTAARVTISGTDTAIGDKIHIKNVKIYSDYQNSSSLVMDAIPVKRTKDNAVCFYNKVSGTYHLRNDGSTPDYGTL